MPFDPDHPRFFRLFAVMFEPADGSIRLEITSGGQMALRDRSRYWSFLPRSP